MGKENNLLPEIWLFLVDALLTSDLSSMLSKLLNIGGLREVGIQVNSNFILIYFYSENLEQNCQVGKEVVLGFEYIYL